MWEYMWIREIMCTFNTNYFSTGLTNEINSLFPFK
mgnify:CR=1 FL=1